MEGVRVGSERWVVRRPVRLPWRLVVVACLVIACAIICVHTRQQVMSVGYSISEANRRLEEESLENGRLMVLRARLRSPEHLQRQAVRFGLAEPHADQVVRVP